MSAEDGKEGKSKLSRFYDDFYAGQEGAAFGQGPEQTVRDILLHKRSGSAADFGAGDGRNALFLAEHGFDVTAYDISQEGLAKLSKQAGEKRLTIQTEERDVAFDPPEGPFDVSVSTYMLQHLPDGVARRFLATIRAEAPQGALHAISVFVADGTEAEGRFYPAPGELKALYSDWTVLEYEEKNVRLAQDKPDGSPDFSLRARILAQKP